jgi:molecular chaperone GrpE
MLSIVDDLERAIKLDDNILDDEVSKFLSGIKIIYTRLISILEKYEVKEIDALNKEFDPTYHQAVLTEKVEGVKPNMVVEVLQKGYMYKDRVLRHTMVKVSE